MKNDRIKNLLINISGTVFALILLSPMLLTFLLSIMDKLEIQSINNALLAGDNISFNKLMPRSFSLRQYFIVLFNRLDFLEHYWNSCKIVFPIVLGQTVLGSLAAYGFAKFKFLARDKIFFIFIITMLLPFQVTLVPNFIVAIKLGIYEKFSSIYLPGIFSAFGVFYLRQYMKEIPDEIIEAARIDGANEIQIFMRIIVPLAKPFIFSLAVLTFIDTWNLVEQPLVMLPNSDMHPLSLTLAVSGKKDFDIAFAASILYLLPTLILYYCSRKDLESGLKHLGLK